MFSDSTSKKEWLKKRAEELLNSKEKLNPLDFTSNLEELVENLQVYQIELEMQNVELMRVQQSLERVKSRFETLFSQAPVGYCTISDKGEMIDVNDAFCNLLNLTIDNCKGKKLSAFVHPSSQDDYYLHLKSIKGSVNGQSVLLKFRDNQKPVFIKLHTSQVQFEGDNKSVFLCTLSDISNEINYQHELHLSEERFRSLITSIDDVVFTLDTQQRHTAVYGKWLEKFNQTPNDYLGKTSADMMGKELAQVHEKHNIIALEGKNVVYEWDIETGIGMQYFQTSLSPIFGANRDIIGLVGIARNITERKNAELALAEKELQYRTLADSGQALIWASGLDMKCNYFNQVWLDFTGRKIEQELGDGWAEGVHPEDMERCISIYTNAFNRREKFSMPYRLRHFTGEYRWIQDDGTPCYNSKGEFTGYIGHCLDISERKSIEEELTVSESKFRLIFDNAPVGIFHYNQQGFITACNNAFVKIIGSSHSQIIGLNLLKLPNRSVVKAVSDSLTGKRGFFEGNYEPVTAIKSLYIKAYFEPAQFQNGEVTDGIGIVEDITQRKQAEEALRESEEKYRTLVDSANDIIYSVTPEGIFTFVSPNWSNILGHKTEDVIGKSFAEFVHPEDVHLCANFLQSILETGKRQSGVEYRVLHSDGKWRWHRSNGSIRRLKNDTIEYVGVARDITELKIAELSIIERMKEINCLYEVSLLGHKTGISLQSYLEKSVKLIPFGFLNPDNTAAKISIEDNIAHTQNFVESKYCLTSKIWLKENIIGSIEVVLTHSNDDSEKPFLDEEQTLLDLLASNMAQVIAREKIMNEISMKNVALQELNAEKDKILSIIAHDLRSPLSTIIGLSELLENKYNSIESRKGLIMVQGISKTSNRLYQLLENLLDWARLKRGKIDFIPKVNNLREIATTSVGIYEDQISIKQLNLTIEIDSALTVFADANMVQTIFRNLISNAIKFSNRNGQITISASKADSNFVQVSIADSGVGMDRVVFDSLFHISNEAGRTGTEDEPSSGFGLPLCKELVEKNGGVIWAESQEGLGSRLSFTLPANSINN
jgi:PAS domain S-box-containing protein